MSIFTCGPKNGAAGPSSEAGRSLAQSLGWVSATLCNKTMLETWGSYCAQSCIIRSRLLPFEIKLKNGYASSALIMKHGCISCCRAGKGGWCVTHGDVAMGWSVFWILHMREGGNLIVCYLCQPRSQNCRHARSSVVSLIDILLTMSVICASYVRSMLSSLCLYIITHNRRWGWSGTHGPGSRGTRIADLRGTSLSSAAELLAGIIWACVKGMWKAAQVIWEAQA